MSSQPHFNDHYKSLLDQLPPSMKKDAWLRLTTCKNNPLSEKQARGIRPDIEELLTSNVNRYYKSKIARRLRSKQIPPLMVLLLFPDWMDWKNSWRSVRLC